MDILLVQTKLLEGRARSDVHLRLHDVDTGDFLGNGVLDLDTGVHLDEDVVAALVHEELDGASALVVDVLAELHSVRTDAVTQFRIQRRSRSDLHDLLVTTLHGAVTLEEVDDVALAIGEDLDLNVLRLNHGGLKVDVAVAEGSLGLTGGLRALLAQLGLVLDETHAASAATCDCLDEDRVGEVLGVLDELVQVSGRLGVLQGRQARFLSGVHRSGLIAGEVQGLRSGANELDSGLVAGTGKVGALREEAVTRVDGIRARLLGGTNHLINIEVRLHRGALSANANGFVGECTVEGVAILTWINCHGLRADFESGTEGTDSNFAAVGYKHLVERR